MRNTLRNEKYVVFHLRTLALVSEIFLERSQNPHIIVNRIKEMLVSDLLIDENNFSCTFISLPGCIGLVILLSKLSN